MANAQCFKCDVCGEVEHNCNETDAIPFQWGLFNAQVCANCRSKSLAEFRTLCLSRTPSKGGK